MGKSSKVRRKSLGGPDEGVSAVNDRSERTPLLKQDADSEDNAAADILGMKRERDRFCDHRMRCIFNDTRAVQTLDHWARLDISIINALDLVNPADTWISESEANSSVHVFSDDNFVYETHNVRGQSPKWNHAGHLNIIAPDTMVRIHVKHGDDEKGLGFVEFCVADIPFDQEIVGYFELRFDQRLQRTSVHRYKEHCRRRDETEVEEQFKQANTRETPGMYIASGSDLTNHGVAITRSYSELSDGGFVQPHARRSALLCCRSPSGNIQEDAEPFRMNAGEICLRLKLSHIGANGQPTSWLDLVFARALRRPPPKKFAGHGVPHSAGLADIQGLYDEAKVVKAVLWDETILSVKNYIIFILKWRRIAISFVFLVLFMTAAANEHLQGPLLLFTIAFVMTLNSSDELRYMMACGGDNAPLDEQGFRCVAAMKDAKQMHKFLKRTIEIKLGSSVKEDTAQLQMISERCFRDGVPSLGYEELKDQLSRVQWLNRGKTIGPGSLVMVMKERDARGNVVPSNQYPRVATVQAVWKNHHDVDVADVQYDQTTKYIASRGSTSRDKDGSVTVLMEDINPRIDWSTPQTVLSTVSAPQAVDVKVKEIRSKMDRLQWATRSRVTKAVRILAWKDSRLAMGITVACYIASLGLLIFHEWYRMCGGSLEINSPWIDWLMEELNIRCGSTAAWKEYEGSLYVFHFLLAFIIGHGASTFVLLAGTFIFLFQAKWIWPARAMCRMLWKLLTERRSAPAKWPFFRKDVQSDPTAPRA